MLRQIMFVVSVYFCLPYYSVRAKPRVPEHAEIRVTDKYIYFRFQWEGTKPDFSQASAVEFEVTINPKCFAQPFYGGRDNYIKFAQNNFPASNGLKDGYTDVWNYWAPSSPYIRIAEMEKHCGSISQWCKTGLEWSSIVDKDLGNFAVGTRNPDKFLAGEPYWFKYPLETATKWGCSASENAGGWIRINMAVFPDKCTLCSKEEQTCPHLIGLQTPVPWGGIEQCPEIDTDPIDRQVMIKRLCAWRHGYDDEMYYFVPGQYVEDGGSCDDRDGDGYFALNYSSETDLPRAMYGHRVGDCEDNPNNQMATEIQDENYDPSTGTCFIASELNCNDGLDDDADGDIDCNDYDCTLDPHCLITCTPICNPGNSQCNGNNVEVCSDDQCSFVYDHSCGIDEACINGACITNGALAPVINTVSCNTYQRGDIATCTIYGSNFVAGGDTYIEDMENRQILSLSSNQVVVHGLWHCMNPLGYKQVSHRNPDNQRDDTYFMVEIVMGELQITGTWPEYVHEGDSNFTVGADGCNFGSTPVVYVEGVQVSNVSLQSEGEVNGTGTVVAESDGTSGDICIAQYSGASIGFAKKCCYDCITILP
jgi:hypothetical protein